jgi:hypothetical protein
VSDIDINRLKQSILEDGAEDYTGLYEIIWSLNTHYPEIDHATKLSAARPIFLDLLRRGEVILFSTRWASSQYDPVPADKAVELATSPKSWEDPGDDPYVCYATP